MKQLEAHVEKSFWRKNVIAIVIGVLALGAIGYYFYSKQNTPVRSETAATIYTCPMHPQIRSDKPGSCPICGMTLVPKREGAADKTAAIPGSVTVSAAEAIKANVQVVAIERRPFIKDIQSVGTIKIAEPGEHVISARTRGRIDKLYINATGKTIRKGEPLYEFYSPDLLNAEQEYLIAKNEHGVSMPNDADRMHGDMNEGLVAAGKERLKLYGLSDNQIADIIEEGITRSTITVLAPESGIVLQKLVQEGAYVDEG
ncbi:MAG: efflux RND transporter periplasmic adaptor subunit, partial [Bacteroidota bacterium]|nr:efflux RND transporter periplasmic adaptor subunit [Bacteroidota bacterium]